MKAHWLQFTVSNLEPRRPLGAAITTHDGQVLVITDYWMPRRPQGHFVYEAADAHGALRYVFEADIADVFDKPRPEPRLVVDNTRRAA